MISMLKNVAIGTKHCSGLYYDIASKYVSFIYRLVCGLSISVKEHGCLPHDIARTLTTRRICLGHSISSILI